MQCLDEVALDRNLLVLGETSKEVPELRLWGGTKIGSDEAVWLSRTIAEREGLRSLILHKARLDIDSFEVICQAVAEHPSIVAFEVDAPLGDEGAKIASQRVVTPKSKLHTLSLTGLKITNEGALQLARALQAGGCPKLQSLSLTDNNISREGITAIANQIGARPDVKRFIFLTNPVGREIEPVLQLVKHRNKGISLLYDGRKLDETRIMR